MKNTRIIVALIIIGGIAFTFLKTAPAEVTTDAVVEVPTETIQETSENIQPETEVATASEEISEAHAITDLENPTEIINEPEEVISTSEIISITTHGGDAVLTEKTFDLTGKSFEFNVTEIRVQEGDSVTINFESTNGFHDWVVDEFDAATKQVRENTPTSVTFVADKAGSYEYYCSVGSHRSKGMVGTLIVK